MIPGTLNSETHVTRIEIQNEVKTTKIKKSANCLTPVEYSDLPRKGDAKEFSDSNAEIIKVINRDKSVTNLQECRKLFAVNNVYKVEIEEKSIKKGGSKSKKSGPDIPDIPDIKKPDQEPEKTANVLSNLFLLKVLGLTCFMTVITAVFVTMVYISDDLRELLLDTQLGSMLILAAGGGMLLLNYKVMCSPCMRVFPCNFVSLIIAVICMSLIAASVTATHNTTMIVYALIATAITVFVCFLLALTSFDFTKFILYIFAVGLTVFVLTIVVVVGSMITGIRYRPLELVLLFVGTLVNVVVLITELQLILGGKTVSLSEDDYALGAFMLYTSIVDLFLKLLQLVGVTLDEEGEFFSDLV